MSDDSLTHADLSRLLGVSVTTVKSYRRKFPGFLPALASGKPLRFPASSARVCADIRDAFARGLSVQDIHRILSTDFPELSKNRRLSISQTAPGPVAARVLESLARELAELTRNLDDALARLDRLESARAAAASPPLSPPAPEPAPEPPGRVIRIRTRDGEHQRFRLTPLGPDPDEAPSASPAASPDGAAAPGSPTPLQPPAGLLDNPLVVRSGKGEFLGISGVRSRHFRTCDLLDLMAARHPTAQAAAWSRSGEAWILTVPLGAEPFRQDHELTLEPTTTPRGNQVTLLTGMAVGGKPVPQSFLHAFLRQLGKEQE